jgi:hypothetical protein
MANKSRVRWRYAPRWWVAALKEPGLKDVVARHAERAARLASSSGAGSASYRASIKAEDWSTDRPRFGVGTPHREGMAVEAASGNLARAVLNA